MADTSWQAKFIRATSALYMSLKDAETVDVFETRTRLDRVAAMVPRASGVDVASTRIADCNAEWLVPKDVPEDKLLLYWHGGAYIMGSCASHRPVVSHLARDAGVRALLPEYRLAPEHPFPAAIEDAVAVYRQLLAEGFEPGNIAVAGDSAGGGLTVAMLLSLRDAGDPLPGAVALLSPWLDLSGSGESMATREEHDPWFSPEDLPHVTRYYCDSTDLTNPLVSPVYADLSGLPRTLIQVGNDEILLSDSERMAAQMRAAGDDVTIDVWPGMWHVWQMFIGLMPESKAAVEKLGAFIDESLGVGGS